ncbi:serine/threonine protein kinase [Candidatus Micrarchaeota archaeon]|nr:serine/threonine protein kinase [Candidatus Micrarchaeota archaeon]
MQASGVPPSQPPRSPPSRGTHPPVPVPRPELHSYTAAQDPLIDTVISGIPDSSGNAQKYQIVSVFREGGSSRIYLGRAFPNEAGAPLGSLDKAPEKTPEKTPDEHTFAIKVLRSSFKSNDRALARFLREAEILQRLSYHTNILRYVDHGTIDANSGVRPYLVTEYLQGKTLSQFIAAHRDLSWKEASFYIKQMLEGLMAVHGQDILHRDLKPENIIILADGTVKILDFGIAKDITRSNLTAQGQLFGTPDYMSPEQMTDPGAVDLRSDIFALGVIMFEMVADASPFTQYNGHNYTDLVREKLAGKYFTPSAVRSDILLPPNIEQIIMRAMAPKSGARYQSARELRDAIFAAEGLLVDPGAANALSLSPDSSPLLLTAAPAITPAPAPVSSPSPSRKSSRFFMAVGVTAAIAALAAAGSFGAILGSRFRPAQAPQTPQAYAIVLPKQVTINLTAPSGSKVVLPNGSIIQMESGNFHFDLTSSDVYTFVDITLNGITITKRFSLSNDVTINVTADNFKAPKHRSSRTAKSRIEPETDDLSLDESESDSNSNASGVSKTEGPSSSSADSPKK